MKPIFIHPPRCGGTSLRSVMDRLFKTACCGPGDLMEEVVAKNPDANAWYGHMPFGLHQHIKDGHYLTLLRNPHDRIYSEMRRRGITSATELFCRYPEQSNMATRLIAGMNDLRAPVKDVHLDRAILNIGEHFFAVGILERFEEFLLSLGWSNGDEPPHLNGGPPADVSFHRRPHVPYIHIEHDLTLYDYAREIAP